MIRASHFYGQHFAFPLNGDDGHALNSLDKIFDVARYDAWVEDLNLHNLPAKRAFAKTAQNRFNLREFRHSVQSRLKFLLG